MTYRPGVRHLSTGRFQAERFVGAEGWYRLGFGRGGINPKVSEVRGAIPAPIGPGRRQASRAPRPCTWHLLIFAGGANPVRLPKEQSKKGPAFPPDPFKASLCRLRFQARTGALLSMGIRVGQTKSCN